MKKIEIWTFKFCPFCVKAKRLLDALNVEYEEIRIPNNDKRMDALEAKTGCDTLPQIFADGEFVGDCSKIHELHDMGQLMKILEG